MHISVRSLHADGPHHCVKECGGGRRCVCEGVCVKGCRGRCMSEDVISLFKLVPLNELPKLMFCLCDSISYSISSV